MWKNTWLCWRRTGTWQLMTWSYSILLQWRSWHPSCWGCSWTSYWTKFGWPTCDWYSYVESLKSPTVSPPPHSPPPYTTESNSYVSIVSSPATTSSYHTRQLLKPYPLHPIHGKCSSSASNWSTGWETSDCPTCQPTTTRPGSTTYWNFTDCTSDASTPWDQNSSNDSSLWCSPTPPSTPTKPSYVDPSPTND